MTPIKYFILEDVQLEAKMLQENLNRFPELEFVGHSGEITDAVTQILEKDPDLLFWDHNLIGGKAFEVFEKLEKLGAVLPCCVGASIFDKLNMEMYSKYQHLFIDNFTKPFFNSDFDNRIRAIILKIRKLLNQNDQVIHEPHQGFFFAKTFATNNPIVRIEIDDIVYLEVETTLVTVHMIDNAKIKIEIALSRLLSVLQAPHLKQVNRNTAVNIRHLKQYESGRIIVPGKRDPIPLNDAFKRRFEGVLNVINL